MPNRKAQQVQWSADFVQNVGPVAATYGYSSATMKDFEDINTKLQAAWLVSSNVDTRTRTTVRITDDLLKQMRAAAGRLSAIAHATQGVTDAMLTSAGFTVRKAGRTPPPVPATAPFVEVTSTRWRTATFRARGETGRGRPAKVAGLMVYTRKAGQADWAFALATTRTEFTLDFGPSAVGDSVEVCACWTNSRDQAGPMSEVVRLDLPAAETMPKRNAGKIGPRLAA
jgi:hypothetical protein